MQNGWIDDTSSLNDSLYADSETAGLAALGQQVRDAYIQMIVFDFCEVFQNLLFRPLYKFYNEPNRKSVLPNSKF